MYRPNFIIYIFSKTINIYIKIIYSILKFCSYILVHQQKL